MPGPPLKQYELTLQNAQRVLISLLEQPAKPWVPFDALLRELGQQLALLQRRSAACLLQRRQRARARAEGQNWRGSDFRKVPTRKAGGYEDSPKKVLIPVPPIQAPGGPLNPLEKRRHMVAAQLAISNPARLARSRRRPDLPPPREGQGGTQEEPIVALPKLQPLVACTVGRKARGDFTELAAAPLELLLKEVKEEPDDRPDEQVDQLGLLGQCDSAGISMAPPPAFGAWPRPSSAKAPRRSPFPCGIAEPCQDGKVWSQEGRPTPPRRHTPRRSSTARPAVLQWTPLKHHEAEMLIRKEL